MTKLIPYIDIYTNPVSSAESKGAIYCIHLVSAFICQQMCSQLGRGNLTMTTRLQVCGGIVQKIIENECVKIQTC